jgi:glycosyltransferase involved in cell wall biosynthesis
MSVPSAAVSSLAEPASSESLTVAVIIPCLNESATVSKVVADFRAALPAARIIVVDNMSTDGTADLARAAGAAVVVESRRGKGYALIRGFQACRDAEYVVMVDGDDTYPAQEVDKLLAALAGGADMAIGTRLLSREDGALSRSHSIGNHLFIWLVRVLFGVRTSDLFSGYRALTRRFVDLSALVAQGFEVETEMSMQALVHGFQVAEVPVRYRSRPVRSASKLNAARDGYRILIAVIAFFRDYRPLTFFGALGAMFFLLSGLAGWPVVTEYLRTGLVFRLPLAVLAVGLGLLGAMSLIGGLILSSINRRSAELAALLSRR